VNNTAALSTTITVTSIVKPIARTPERRGGGNSAVKAVPKISAKTSSMIAVESKSPVPCAAVSVSSTSTSSSTTSSLSSVVMDNSLTRPNAIAPPYTFFCPFTSTMPPSFIAEKAAPLIPVVASYHHGVVTRGEPRRTRHRATSAANSNSNSNGDTTTTVQHISLDKNPRRTSKRTGMATAAAADDINNLDHGGEATLTVLSTPGRTRVASRRDTFIAPRAVQDAFGLPSTVRLSRMALDALCVLSYGLPYYRQFITRQLEGYHSVSGPLRARAHRSSRHRGPASPSRNGNGTGNGNDKKDGNDKTDENSGGLASAGRGRRTRRSAVAEEEAESSSSSEGSSSSEESDESSAAATATDNDDDDESTNISTNGRRNVRGNVDQRKARVSRGKKATKASSSSSSSSTSARRQSNKRGRDATTSKSRATPPQPRSTNNHSDDDNDDDDSGISSPPRIRRARLITN
jgi:hypothetical protein